MNEIILTSNWPILSGVLPEEIRAGDQFTCGTDVLTAARNAVVRGGTAEVPLSPHGGRLFLSKWMRVTPVVMPRAFTPAGGCILCKQPVTVAIDLATSGAGEEVMCGTCSESGEK